MRDGVDGPVLLLPLQLLRRVPLLQLIPDLPGLDHLLQLALLLESKKAVAGAAAAADDERDEHANDGGEGNDGHVADVAGVLVLRGEKLWVVTVRLVDQARGLAQLVRLCVVLRTFRLG